MLRLLRVHLIALTLATLSRKVAEAWGHVLCVVGARWYVKNDSTFSQISFQDFRPEEMRRKNKSIRKKTHHPPSQKKQNILQFLRISERRKQTDDDRGIKAVIVWFIFRQDFLFFFLNKKHLEICCQSPCFCVLLILFRSNDFFRPLASSLKSISLESYFYVLFKRFFEEIRKKWATTRSDDNDCVLTCS